MSFSETETDKFYTAGDFADLHNDPVVTRTLSRLAKSGFVIRISQGIYLYPKQTEFGPKLPTVYEVAKTIAKKDKSDIIPSGMTALNELGLSTQIPMKAIYLTNGTPRTIKLGKRTIVFKHSVPKMFSYKSKTFPMVVLALKEIGEENITEEIISSLKEVLSKEKKQDLIRHDYNLAPQWIRKKLLLLKEQLCQQLKNKHGQNDGMVRVRLQGPSSFNNMLCSTIFRSSKIER
jgi:hypothetical protein